MTTTTHKLEALPGVKPREGPVVLIIIDGFGVDKPGKGNPIPMADMRYYDSLLDEAKVQHTLTRTHSFRGKKIFLRSQLTWSRVRLSLSRALSNRGTSCGA
jgi:hypothetical protein